MDFHNQSNIRVFLLLVFIVILISYFKLAPDSWGYSSKFGTSTQRAKHPFLTETEEIEYEEKLSYAAKHPKIIVAWDGELYKARYIRPESAVVERECGSCVVTTNNSQVYAEETAAVVVNYHSLTKESFPPTNARKKNQIFVLQVGDPVYRLRSIGYERIDSRHFNATIMFWRDSNNIYGPYGSRRKTLDDAKDFLRQRLQNDVQNILKLKTKMAAIVASNCGYTSGANVRLDFVKQLVKQGLAVDGFGRCFNKPIAYSSKRSLFRSDDLIPYKFYLAFENSYHCRDYITEKFFSNGLGNLAVPVVWGAFKEDYAAVAPRDSYIYVDDFETVKDLVDYLNYLDQNDDAYMQYFKWLDDPIEETMHYHRRFGFCQLCRIVNGINIEDVYSSDFNKTQPERPLLSKEVSHRTIPPLQQLIDSKEQKQCFWTARGLLTANETLPARESLSRKLGLYRVKSR